MIEALVLVQVFVLGLLVGGVLVSAFYTSIAARSVDRRLQKRLEKEQDLAALRRLYERSRLYERRGA